MLTLPASQSALVGRGSVAPILLVHLTTFTNYTAATVESEWWWTRSHPVLYPWAGGTARSFEDVIRGISPIVQGMEHLAKVQVADTRRSSLDLVLANDIDGNGDTLWKRLRTRNLHFAKVELASLLVEPSRLLDVSPTAKRWDLRDLPGTEHVHRYRGELMGVVEVTETEILLKFQAIEPNVSWPVCTVETDCDPRHLGNRYPIPVGRAKSVPCINRRVGWVTTLAQALTSGTSGSILVTDATGISGAGVELQVGAERMTVTAVDATHVSITARGQQGTTAIPHNAGEAIVEVLASNVLVFSGVQAKALDALYVISPLTGDKVLVPSSGYTTTLADTTTDSGRTISTVSFTAAQFRALIDSLAAISQQPTATATTVQVPFGSTTIRTGTDGHSFPVATNALFIAEGARVEAAASGTDHIRYSWPSDAGIPNASASVIRFRCAVTFNVEGDAASTYPSTQIRIAYTDVYNRSHGFNGHEIIYTETGDGSVGVVAATAWQTPFGSQVVGDLEVDAAIDVWIAGTGAGTWSVAGNWAVFFHGSGYLEVEVQSDITDVAIAALSLGFGMDFVADVQGAQTGGTLHESAPDVIEWFLEEFAGLTGAADAASFATAETNLGANKLAGVLNLAGETFGEVVARLCYESRTNLVAREGSSGTVYRLLAAESDYGFPAAARTLTEIKDQTETGRASTERATRFRAFYALDLGESQRVLNEEDFPSVVRIDAAQNDASAVLSTSLLTAAETLIGQRDALPISFYFVNDEATAIDVLAYSAHEALRTGSRQAGSVPWDAGYDVEIGDLLELTPRGAASPVKGRVIQTSLLLDSALVGLELEEVE